MVKNLYPFVNTDPQKSSEVTELNVCQKEPGTTSSCFMNPVAQKHLQPCKKKKKKKVQGFSLHLELSSPVMKRITLYLCKQTDKQ